LPKKSFETVEIGPPDARDLLYLVIGLATELLGDELGKDEGQRISRPEDGMTTFLKSWVWHYNPKVNRAGRQNALHHRAIDWIADTITDDLRRGIKIESILGSVI